MKIKGELLSTLHLGKNSFKNFMLHFIFYPLLNILWDFSSAFLYYIISSNEIEL